MVGRSGRCHLYAPPTAHAQPPQMIRRRARSDDTRSRFTGRGWVAGAIVVVVLGAVGSLFAARAVAHSDKQKSQRALAATSADVTARLRLALQHEEDLVVSTSAFIVSNPRISNAKFNEWVLADRVVERYPEILGLGRIVVVPRSQLANYGARAIKDPAGPLAPGRSFQVIPPGKRPFYCFIDLAGRSPSLMVTPAVLDVCAATGTRSCRLTTRARQLRARSTRNRQSTGRSNPALSGRPRSGTAAGRRAAFIGWIGIALTPKVVMLAALEAHPHTALTLRYDHPGTSGVAFRAGKAPRGAESLTVDLHNGWTVRATAVVDGGAVFANWHALSVVARRDGLSVLVGLLGVVLATGRTRALRLVSEQTVELRDQAAELRVTVDELEAAQAVKDEFSHRLPRAAHSTDIHSRLRRTAPGQELADEQREYVNVIDRNSARLGGLVEDLLLMAKIQSGGVPLERRRGRPQRPDRSCRRSGETFRREQGDRTRHRHRAEHRYRRRPSPAWTGARQPRVQRNQVHAERRRRVHHDDAHR